MAEPAAPATPADPAQAATTPITATTPPGEATIHLPVLEGESVLRTVPTILGEALIYPGAVQNALPRTVTALEAEGYTVTDGNSPSGVKLEHLGQSLTLTVKQHLGLTVLALSGSPKTLLSAPVVTPTDSSAPVTAPADPVNTPADPAAGPDTDSPTAAPETAPVPSGPVAAPELPAPITLPAPEAPGAPKTPPPGPSVPPGGPGPTPPSTP